MPRDGVLINVSPITGTPADPGGGQNDRVAGWTGTDYHCVPGE